VNNYLFNPGQTGIAIISGDDILVEHNQIYSAQTPFSNVGIYAWNQWDAPSGKIEIAHNLVEFKNAAGEANSWWKDKNMDVNEHDNAWDCIIEPFVCDGRYGPQNVPLCGHPAK
jgi:hypothetical protein